MQRITDEDLAEFVGLQEAQSIISMAEVYQGDEFWDFVEQGSKIYGDPTPWNWLNDKFRFRPGELTIWGGYNGHGKSMLLSHFTAVWIGLGPLVVASLEMTARALGERLARQIAGRGDLARDMFERLHRKTMEYWIYDVTDSVKSDRIIGLVAYAASKLGCRHAIIDSMVKCGVKVGDNSAQSQRDFVDRLCWVAKTYKIHIHLVHHLRKGDSEHKPGGKMDIKGAGEISDLADNVLICWRNKPKEDALQENEQDLGVVDDPDALLFVAKQRHGEWEGKCRLWFDRESRQFLATRRDVPDVYF